MKTTIIITNRNYGDLAKDAIESALLQFLDYDKEKLEVIVVDDDSVDNSRKVYEEYRSLPVLYASPSGGPGAARNLGIRHAWDMSDVFVFLDADDKYTTTEAVLKLVAPLNDPRIGLVYCDYIGDFGRTFLPPYAAEKLMKRNDPAWHPTNFAVARAAIERCGPFNESFKVAENIELARRIASRHVLVHIPEALIVTRRTSRALRETVGKDEWEYYEKLSR